MDTILLIAGVLAVGWLLYNRGRVVAGVPFLRALTASLHASGRPGELAPLIASLYDSITDRSRRTWWTRTHHVGGEEWTIIAAPTDAALLAGSIRAVEADLNAALRDNADRHQIVIEAPVRIRAVQPDHHVAIGRPQLRSESVGAPGSIGAQGSPKAAPAPRAGTVRSTAGGTATAVRTSKTSSATDGSQAPTKLAATIGETLVASSSRARLWPISPDVGQDPIVVPDAGIVLGRSADLGVGRFTSRTVSGRHAELRRVGETWVIRDLGSHNGTFLGARRVEEAKVRSGNVIGLGHHVRVRLVVGE
jgi:hypothetical protein